MWGRRNRQDVLPVEDWSRQLKEQGCVEFAPGGQVICLVDEEAVELPTRGLRVPWTYLGFVDGDESPPRLFSPASGRLTLQVSRPWWTERIAASTGKERQQAEQEMTDGWASPSVFFGAGGGAPVEAFAEWLSGEAIDRAPLPERLCVTQASESGVIDRDTNRPVPIDRLPLTDPLRERLASWRAAADAISMPAAADPATWERFLPEGRALAREIQAETGRSAAVWADCTDMP